MVADRGDGLAGGGDEAAGGDAAVLVGAHTVVLRTIVPSGTPSASTGTRASTA